MTFTTQEENGSADAHPPPLRAATEALYRERASWFAHRRELSDYILPRRGAFVGPTNRADRGGGVNGKLLDATAMLAARARRPLQPLQRARRRLRGAGGGYRALRDAWDHRIGAARRSQQADAYDARSRAVDPTLGILRSLIS